MIKETLFYKDVKIGYWREYNANESIPDNYTQNYSFIIFDIAHHKHITIKSNYKYDIQKAIDYALDNNSVAKFGILKCDSKIINDICSMKFIKTIDPTYNKLKGFEDFF